MIDRNLLLHSRFALGALATALAAVAPLSAAHAQAVQPWPDLVVSTPLGQGWQASAEALGRIADDTRPSQAETRLLLGHTLGRNVTGWIGWVHLANFNPGAPNGHENQVAEQLNWAIGALGPVRISTRTRLEQRFISNVEGVSWRWRQQVRLALPLAGKRGPSAVVWAEPYIGLNHTSGQPRTLDQTRVFVGLALPVSPRVDLEFGYLEQRIHHATSTTLNHAIPIVITARF